MLQAFANWFAGVIQTIWGWIVDFFYFTVGWAFQYVWNFIVDKALAVIQPISSLIPSFDFDFTFVTGPMWVLLNEWVPVTYAFTCFGIYVGIAVVVYAVNWALGLIPTVS